jgi:hypothetical protein
MFIVKNLFSKFGNLWRKCDNISAVFVKSHVNIFAQDYFLCSFQLQVWWSRRYPRKLGLMILKRFQQQPLSVVKVPAL